MSGNLTGTIDTELLNSEVFFAQLDRLMGACIGVIAIRTREIERARTLLHEWASMREMDYNVWTPISGYAKYKRIPTARGDNDTDRPSLLSTADTNIDYMTPEQPMDAKTMLAENALLTFEERAIEKDNTRNRFCGVFIGLTPDVLARPDVQTHIRNHVQRSYTNDDRIFMILSPGVSIPPEMQNDVELIDLNTPSYAELLEALSDMDDAIKDQLSVTLSDDDKQAIVQNGMGMTHQEFENAISLAIVDLGERVKLLDGSDLEINGDDFIRVVRERKLAILRDTQILELMPTSKMSDVGGLDLLKKWLDKRALAFDPEARAFGIKPPKGFILVGPPGGGKSLVTQAVCNSFGQAGIRFDIGKVFGAFVGQSEERTRMALKMLEDMAPCVVQIEEIEKALGGGGGGGDGGVGTRVFGTILTWMQDRADRGIPVTVVASANDVTKIPPELLRKGRFDAIFGISFPTIEERQQILKIHVEKRGHSLSDADILKVAKATPKFVGAELESIVEEALFDDFEEGNDGITVESLLRAAENTIPQVEVFPERIEQMKEFVEKNAKPASSGSTFDVSAEPIPGVGTRVKRPSGGLRLSKAPKRSPRSAED